MSEMSSRYVHQAEVDQYVSGGHEKFETPIIPIQDVVHPGDTCPTCSRRVPHPRKPSSPTTKPIAYRCPLDEYDAHLEVIDAVAELLGVKEEKFHRYKAISYAAAAVLQHGLRVDD